MSETSAPDNKICGFRPRTLRRSTRRARRLRFDGTLGEGIVLVRTLKTVLLIAGAVALGLLVYHVGAGPIIATLGRLRWWQFVIICIPYALITAVDTLGWRFAFARGGGPYWR